MRLTEQPLVLGIGDWLSIAASSGWLVAGLVSTLTSSKRRAVHDFIAGSVVLRQLKPAVRMSAGAV
jgi:uncharacterized RDD family membrane protein YckC